ncbi:hypothetical protein LNKW23_14890 [Paralimibaculum aggregatum]|uniref:Uncharacterized protein n=1 Tax=Paralimibaculum aggregatum TaxID=3036245 RepID=A0ABQ6LG27_9RHOB|nr:hypothetical protein [Limibaculum sp. NKW23]GMG82276.1 hypothetical protein LNKW23_14890 [Limibaculum sp. NKW23]
MTKLRGGIPTLAGWSTNMKEFIFLCLLASSPSDAIVPQPVGIRLASDDIAHGGGCRKSSPPGQCCHMDRKAGKVHCH